MEVEGEVGVGVEVLFIQHIRVLALSALVASPANSNVWYLRLC